MRDRQRRAGRQEPLRRERGGGPQHHVTPAASSDYQPKGRGSRAGHATAKATDSAERSEQRWIPPGYGERHVSTARCGTGEALPGGSSPSKTTSIRRSRNGGGSGGSPRGAEYRRRAGELPGGKGPYFGHAFAWGEARGHERKLQPPGVQSARTPADAVASGQAESGAPLPRAVRPDLQAGHPVGSVETGQEQSRGCGGGWRDDPRPWAAGGRGASPAD